MSTLQSLSLSSPGCFHSSLAFEQVVFVFFLTFFILRKMVDLPQIIPCSPEVHVQNYIFATMKYSLEFMWNKSVHAFIQYLLCDRWCLWGQHFKGKRMPPHQSEHRAWVTTKDWASTPPDCYKAQIFPGKVWVPALPLTNWIILAILLIHLKKKWAKEQYLKGCCESLMKLHSAIVPRTHDTRKSIIFLTHWLDHTYHGSSPAQPHNCAALSIVLFWFLILMTTP